MGEFRPGCAVIAEFPPDPIPLVTVSMIAKLIPVDGSRPIVIMNDITIVGRKRGVCDVIIDHESISKFHCAVARTDGLLFIRDLGSTNGTSVNGQKVTRGALLPGDELGFANIKFRVFLGPGDPGPGNDAQTEAIPSHGLDGVEDVEEVEEVEEIDEDEVLATRSGDDD